MGIIRKSEYEFKHHGQSKEHLALSVMASVWAANKATFGGNHGGVEFYLPKWGLADAAIVEALQYRFMEHYEMIPLGERATYKRILLVFESKVSKGDFKTLKPKIAKHGEPGPGNLNWVVATKGLLTEQELPQGWGLLEPYGSGLTEKVSPTYLEKPELYLLEVQASMLWDYRWYRKYLNVEQCPDCGRERPK